jgi:7-carboxy-7-deazaguanine synthase
MLAKDDDDDTYADVGTDTLVGTINAYQARHVVITGGEPCQYDLTDLTSKLLSVGKSVQIETSGTELIRCDDRTWVTVSPKIGMPGGKEVLPEALCRADEIKVPVGKPGDIAKFATLWNRTRYGKERNVLIWLQPLSTSEKATALCIDAATANGWRVSIQTHKFIGVR